MSRPLSGSSSGVKTRQDLVMALRQLLHEACMANLSTEAAALAQVAIAIDQPLAGGLMETVWASPDEAELLRVIIGQCKGGAGERRLRLQALAEVGATLSITDLASLAFVSEHKTPHLQGFLALFDQYPNSVLTA